MTIIKKTIGGYMISTIRKRDGNFASYDKAKITAAISSALKAVGELNTQVADNISAEVEHQLKRKFKDLDVPSVETIQDIVEQTLTTEGYKNVAKVYSDYRKRRTKLRVKAKDVLEIKDVVDNYIDSSDWRVKENANVHYSIGGLILHMGSKISSNYWLDQVYKDNKHIAKMHREGRIHIHDLQMLTGYCAGWSLRDLIKEGLGGVNGKIASAPAKHLATIINQMVNFLGCMQNEWAGAQAFSSVDTLLAPFVYADNLDYKQVKQQIQSFMFGMNIPSRWGSQSPFSNITLDWVCPGGIDEDGKAFGLKHEPAVVGATWNEDKKEWIPNMVLDENGEIMTYGMFKKEMDMINRAILELYLEGDCNGRGFLYPIPTYNITKDFEWDTPNAKLLWELTGKYGTPYFQNFVNSDLNPEDVRSMCCRLQLSLKELAKRGGGLFGAAEMTGSIGVVTINLPQIAYSTKSSERQFFSALNMAMDTARDSLEIKRDKVLEWLGRGLYPWTSRYLSKVKHKVQIKETKEWIVQNELSNHFSTIGIIGMNEACQNFFGEEVTLVTPQGQEFAKKVLNHMRERMIKYQEETGNFYNLEATPGEGTSHRLAGIDRESHPDMIIPGGKNAYYTNSTQLPVQATDDIFEALSLQDELQTLYTGGTVHHGFLGESIEDIEVVKQLVKKISSNYKLPYFTISPTYSVCPIHGYLRGEVEICPKCEKTTHTEVYSRIVGYYRPLKNWNEGKGEEYSHRKTYKSHYEENPVNQKDTKILATAAAVLV
jgi:ribonucleoside-triphosphate reductase